MPSSPAAEVYAELKNAKMEAALAGALYGRSETERNRMRLEGARRDLAAIEARVGAYLDGGRA